MQRDVILTDHTVFERAHCGNMIGCSADHGKRMLTDLDHLIGCSIYRDHAGLVEHNTLIVDVNKHTARTQVNSDIAAEIQVQFFKHFYILRTV